MNEFEKLIEQELHINPHLRKSVNDAIMAIVNTTDRPKIVQSNIDAAKECLLGGNEYGALTKILSRDWWPYRYAFVRKRLYGNAEKLIERLVQLEPKLESLTACVDDVIIRMENWIIKRFKLSTASKDDNIHSRALILESVVHNKPLRVTFELDLDEPPSTAEFIGEYMMSGRISLIFAIDVILDEFLCDNAIDYPFERIQPWITLQQRTSPKVNAIWSRDLEFFNKHRFLR